MAHEQWHPEIEITDNLVKICIEEQFPALAPIKTIQLIGQGWDNKVFLIDDTIMVKPEFYCSKTDKINSNA